MGKMRKCRLDENQQAVHALAVKLRKKTDEQLVDAFQEIYDQGYQNGIDKNKLPNSAIFTNEEAKQRLLGIIHEVPGIGDENYKKISDIVSCM